MAGGDHPAVGCKPQVDRRFRLEDIGGVAGDLAGIQRFKQRFLVDEPGAGGIDQRVAINSVSSMGNVIKAYTKRMPRMVGSTDSRC